MRGLPVFKLGGATGEFSSGVLEGVAQREIANYNVAFTLTSLNPVVVAVPEAGGGTMTLAGLGLLLFFVSRRRAAALFK